MAGNQFADAPRVSAPRPRPDRAVSSARTSWAARDLQWTGLNQPSRINCAMPRASFLSVLTGIVLKAARTWRVSISSTQRPAVTIPGMEPLRQGAGLQANALHRHAVLPEPGDQRIGFAEDLCFPHNAAVRIHHAHTCVFQVIRRCRHTLSWSSLRAAMEQATPDSATPSL